MKIIWTEPALEDVERLGDYIALDQPFYAEEFTERLMSSVEPLAENPRMYRAVPEAGQEQIREVIFHNYRIIYMIRDEQNIIEILAVIHGRRDLDNPQNQSWEKP